MTINLKLFVVDWTHMIKIQIQLQNFISKFDLERKKNNLTYLLVFFLIERKTFFKNFMVVKVTKFGQKLKNILIVFSMNQHENKLLKILLFNLVSNISPFIVTFNVNFIIPFLFYIVIVFILEHNLCVCCPFYKNTYPHNGSIL